MSQLTPSPELVFIVVLHFGSLEHTKACLESLAQLSYPNYRILVVDNGTETNKGTDINKGTGGREPASIYEPSSQCGLSPAGTRERVNTGGRANTAEMDTLTLPENLGFAGGCNAGLKWCLDQGAKWIWLLNNDTIVPLDALDALMSCATSHPQAGALGVLTKDIGGTYWGAGKIDFLRGKTGQLEYSPGSAGAPPAPNEPESIACEWLSGSNLLLQSAALQQVGLFDERYFLYFEDVDLCMRLHQSGWQCLLVTDSAIDHASGASTQGELKLWRDYYYTRNRFLFFFTYLKGLKRIPAAFSIAVHLLRHAIVLPLRGTKGRNKLKAEWLGVKDYFCHHFGESSRELR